MLLTAIFVVVFAILLFVYLRGQHNQNYWKKRGVAFYGKNKCGGPFWQYMISNRSLFELFSDIYKDYENEPAVGIGSIFDKMLFVKDPVNIHHITQADFQSFSHRGIPVNDEDILANNVLFLHGPRWRMLRKKLTPLFTGAKLKNMYYIIDRSAQDFVQFLKQNPDRLKGDAHHIHDTMTHYSAASLSASIFGIGVESTIDSPFRIMAMEAVKPTTALNIKFAIGGISDEIYRFMNFKLFGEHENFFIGAMKKVFRQREQDVVKRHDFADMCMKVQKEGMMHDPDSDLSLEPSDEVMAAQAFLFFLAGTDSTTATMFTLLMQLGRHPVILKRVLDEVDTIFEKYDNKLIYDAISEAEYLDRALSESMRMLPALGYLSRQCTKDTVLPVGNIPVEKGVKVMFPVFDLHNDPKYYPNPEVFDPDRFLREGEISDMTYLPFGKGNRICIGARYARMQVISGLLHFLRHFTVEANVQGGQFKYLKEPAQVRIKNVDIKFVPRRDYDQKWSKCPPPTRPMMTKVH